MASENTREMSGVEPAKQTLRQKAMAPLMGAMMERAAAGEHRWALTIFPTNAYAAGRFDEPRRLRGLLLRAPASPTPRTRSPPGRPPPRRPIGWRSGSRAARRSTITGPGTDLTADRRRPPLHRRRRQAQHARRRVLHRAGRGLGRGRDQLPPAGHLRRPRGRGGAVPLRGGQGRRRERRARRGVPDRDARHRRRRAPPRRARDRHQLRDHRGTGEILLDEKIGGTVHLAIGKSYPDTGGVNDSAIHWDMICDLRRGGADHRRRRDPAGGRPLRRLSAGICSAPQLRDGEESDGRQTSVPVRGLIRRRHRCRGRFRRRPRAARGGSDRHLRRRRDREDRRQGPRPQDREADPARRLDRDRRRRPGRDPVPAFDHRHSRGRRRRRRRHRAPLEGHLPWRSQGPRRDPGRGPGRRSS